MDEYEPEEGDAYDEYLDEAGSAHNDEGNANTDEGTVKTDEGNANNDEGNADLEEGSVAEEANELLKEEAGILDDDEQTLQKIQETNMYGRDLPWVQDEIYHWMNNEQTTPQDWNQHANSKTDDWRDPAEIDEGSAANDEGTAQQEHFEELTDDGLLAYKSFEEFRDAMARRYNNPYFMQDMARGENTKEFLANREQYEKDLDRWLCKQLEAGNLEDIMTTVGESGNEDLLNLALESGFDTLVLENLPQDKIYELAMNGKLTESAFFWYCENNPDFTEAALDKILDSEAYLRNPNLIANAIREGLIDEADIMEMADKGGAFENVIDEVIADGTITDDLLDTLTKEGNLSPAQMEALQQAGLITQQQIEQYREPYTQLHTGQATILTNKELHRVDRIIKHELTKHIKQYNNNTPKLDYGPPGNSWGAIQDSRPKNAEQEYTKHKLRSQTASEIERVQIAQRSDEARTHYRGAQQAIRERNMQALQHHLTKAENARQDYHENAQEYQDIDHKRINSYKQRHETAEGEDWDF